MKRLAVLLVAGLGLAGCATTSPLPPAEAIRYHLGQSGRPVTPGTVAVEPLETTPGAPASLEYRSYAAAVEAELRRNGYTPVPASANPQYLATVAFRRGTQAGPPRRSPFSVGLGVGGADFGRRSAVGGGLGVGIPIGGGGQSQLVVSELEVAIRSRVDQTRVWQGSARAAADIRSPVAQTDALAQRLARALFTGFPGESGRTIEVR